MESRCHREHTRCCRKCSSGSERQSDKIKVLAVETASSCSRPSDSVAGKSAQLISREMGVKCAGGVAVLEMPRNWASRPRGVEMERMHSDEARLVNALPAITRGCADVPGQKTCLDQADTAYRCYARSAPTCTRFVGRGESKNQLDEGYWVFVNVMEGGDIGATAVIVNKANAALGDDEESNEVAVWLLNQDLSMRAANISEYARNHKAGWYSPAIDSKLHNLVKLLVTIFIEYNVETRGDVLKTNPSSG
ncbi:hypothetical protein DFP72DRAFT_849980 [Ephemerocybe angulata]|uniref:Uncharacterized protein n=1 Tax=Ephemerocybe angulata TaxID=980116 RepID=A0A8H6HTT3_9AGAR|nr:hypothetical protein DFP72DRAFT_849980 [Tulosesus angulatus]